MVSAVPAAPVVKLLETAVAVETGASSARLSVTVTVPSAAVIEVPVLPVPRLAVVGTLIWSSPTLTANVTVVGSGVPVVSVVMFGPVGTGITAGAAGPGGPGGGGGARPPRAAPRRRRAGRGGGRAAGAGPRPGCAAGLGARLLRRAS